VDGTVRLFRIRGFDVRAHPLLLLLPAMAAIAGWREGATGIVARAIPLAILLASLLLHEVSHALAARARGLPVLDVRLHLVGGVARIVRPLSRRDDPKDEWAVALAGPAANLGLAAVLYGVRAALGSAEVPLDAKAIALDPLLTALAINALMGSVNLLPVLPADGGRVLRALLSYRMAPLAATRVAVAVSGAAAVLLVAAALWVMSLVVSSLLVLVAVLLVDVARREWRYARMRRRYQVFREFVAAHEGSLPLLRSLPRDEDGLPIPAGPALDDPGVAEALREFERRAGDGKPSRG